MQEKVWTQLARSLRTGFHLRNSSAEGQLKGTVEGRAAQIRGQQFPASEGLTFTGQYKLPLKYVIEMTQRGREA